LRIINKKTGILFVFLITIFFGCKPKEKIIIQEYGKKINEAELENLILSANKDIKTIKMSGVNFTVNIDGEQFKSGGSIAIIRDSVIVISLIPILGYEISRIFCFEDTILVLDRLEKTYFYTSIERNTKRYNFIGDYYDIESILAGRPFIYSMGKDNNKLKKRITKEDDLVKLQYEMIENELVKSSQNIITKYENLLTESNDIADNINHIDINISYGNFNKIEDFVLPYEIGIKIIGTAKKIDILMDIGNIVINEKINAEVIIPVKYEEAIIDY